MANRDIFLLTNPPQSKRAELCLRLMEHAMIQFSIWRRRCLNLLDEALMEKWPGKVMACKEDLDARGVQAGEGVRVPEDFYQLLVEEMVAEGSRIYSF